MNLLKFLDELSLQGKDMEQLDMYSSRRKAFAEIGNFTKKVGLAALPLSAMVALPKAAFAKTNAHATAILNFALTLEYLEYHFYDHGLNNAPLLILSADQRTVLEQIRKHELAHTQFLTTTINAGVAGAAVPDPGFASYDYTANGAYADVFVNPQTFLAVAQAFEDTGVRAYKGQAGKINPSPVTLTQQTYLTAALSIHGVEARHAAEIRRMRGKLGWITLDNTDVPGAAAIYGPGNGAAFPSEANTIQGKTAINTANLQVNGANAGAIAASQSYDEALDANAANGTGTVYDIVTPFL